jgi:Bifunctional DNA primase/polymerase, N-terminal
MTGRPADKTALARALAYARHGWPVFPCRPDRKEPDTSHGFKDATTDPGRITAWWTAVPGRNVAIATGAPGPDVLDVDVRPGGSGYPAWTTLKRAGLLEGSIAIVATPSGGLHAYYAGTSQASGRMPSRHLDFKATGGYVLGRRRQALPADPAPAGPPAGRRAAGLGCRYRPAGPAAAKAAHHAAARPCQCRPAGYLGRSAARRQPERRPVLGRLPRRRNRTPRST